MLYLVTLDTIGSPVLYNVPYRIYKTKEEALKEMDNIQNELSFVCHLYTFKDEDGVYTL